MSISLDTMPPREISPAPLPTSTHSYQLEIGSIIGSLASDQRPGYDFFYFITFGHRLLATIIKNGGHDSDFIYLPLTTSIDMPHILRSKPASNTSGRTLSLRFLRPSGRLGVFVGNSYLCIGGYTQNATPTGRLGSCNLRGFYRCLGLQKKVHM